MAGRGDQLGFPTALVPGGLVQQIQELAVEKVGTVTVLADPGADHTNDICGHQKEQIGEGGGGGVAGPELSQQVGPHQNKGGHRGGKKRQSHGKVSEHQHEYHALIRQRVAVPAGGQDNGNDAQASGDIGKHIQPLEVVVVGGFPVG